MSDSILDDEQWHDADNELLPELVKSEALNINVDAGQELTRIDKFIQVRITGASRSKVQQAIDAGEVLVNDKLIKNNYKVRPHDHIIVYQYKAEGSDEIIPQNIPLNVVYEDDDVIVVNKPAGMVVHPGSGNPNGTLVNAMCYYMQQQLGTLDDLPRVGLVHRIDKDTTGLLLFAKNTHAMMHLSAQFKAHSIHRTYMAIVWGDVAEDEGTITGHIARHANNRMQFDVYPDGDIGKHAITHYKVLQRFGYVTVIQCQLETGRTHQIRVHMKYIGHTLFNDARYGGDAILKGTVYAKYKKFVDNCFEICPRQALHAHTLGFVHPTSGKELSFTSTLPNDMQLVIDKWAKYRINKEV
jgi:23S rRNA pseudouridine1911/1915/1917 synthase